MIDEIKKYIETINIKELSMEELEHYVKILIALEDFKLKKKANIKIADILEAKRVTTQ